MKKLWTPPQIRGLLQRRNLNQKQLAELMRLTPAAVNHWAIGTQSPSPPMCLLLDLIDSGKLEVQSCTS